MSTSEFFKLVLITAFWTIMVLLLCEAPPEKRSQMLPAAYSMEVQDGIR